MTLTCRDRGLVVSSQDSAVRTPSWAQVQFLRGPEGCSRDQRGPAQSQGPASPLWVRGTSEPPRREEELRSAGARRPVPPDTMLVVVREAGPLCPWGGSGCDSRCSVKQSEHKRSLTQEA